MMTIKFQANDFSITEANSKNVLETMVTPNCILNVPFMLLSILGNCLVLVATMRTPSFRSPPVIFLRDLAVSDLLVGLVVQLVYIAAEIARTFPELQQAIRTISFAGCNVSLAKMRAITLDRFLALHYHLQYPNLITTCWATYLLITIWPFCALFSFPFLWSWSIYHFIATLGITILLLVLRGWFHEDSPNCSLASAANSRSTTNRGTFNLYQ